MRYYLIAGEASGDLHGSNLVKGLKKHDPDAEFRFWGGDLMAEAGGKENLARHYKTASFFGFVQVAKNLPEIFSQIAECKKDIAAYKPDVVILIDYPGFNFKIAKYARRARMRTFYYISPKVWAWKESRVKLIRKYVDRLFIIFPFEIEYFRKKGIDTIYEGNPIADVIEQRLAEVPTREKFLESNDVPDDKPIVALLSGSRVSEIKYNLPFMAEVARRFPGFRFVVAGVPWIDISIYDHILAGTGVQVVNDQTYPLLAHSEAALVTSGTATLETALIGTPQVVCYRSDKISMNIGRLILKIPYISLVNLILDKEAVRELIQWDMTMDNAVSELRAVLPGGDKRQAVLEDYERLKEAVGGPGASERFARRMVEILKSEKRNHENNLYRKELPGSY